MKVLQRHTEEQPEVVWHQAFWTTCSSPGPPPLVFTQKHSKCITGKRVTSRKAFSLQPSPQSCSCPCYGNGLPVSHLPVTLQIQIGAAEPFQSPLTGAQTKWSLNPRDNYHTCFHLTIALVVVERCHNLVYIQVPAKVFKLLWNKFVPASETNFGVSQTQQIQPQLFVSCLWPAGSPPF